MTINAHGSSGDKALARQVARVTLDGAEVPLLDVFYLDTRRGVVRRYLSERTSDGKRRMAVVTRADGEIGLLRIEKRGRVRFWLKGAASWGVSKAARA